MSTQTIGLVVTASAIVVLGGVALTRRYRQKHTWCVLPDDFWGLYQISLLRLQRSGAEVWRVPLADGHPTDQPWQGVVAQITFEHDQPRAFLINWTINAGIVLIGPDFPPWAIRVFDYSFGQGAYRCQVSVPWPVGR